MTFRTTIKARLTAHAGVDGIISGRAHPDKLPQSITYPCVVFTVLDSDNSEYRTHDQGPTPREISPVQFDCYAETGDAAALLADQVRAAWDGYKDGCTIGYAFQTNRFSAPQDSENLYREIVQVNIEHIVP